MKGGREKLVTLLRITQFLIQARDIPCTPEQLDFYDFIDSANHEFRGKRILCLLVTVLQYR